MITVWFAADVLEKFKDRAATMRTCENCITQYCQAEHRRSGAVEVSPRVVKQLCEIVSEAIAELDPHLRDIMNLTYTQTDEQSGKVEVRLSTRFRYYSQDSNPGLMRLH